MSRACLKLTTYFGERDRTPHGLLADELLDLYAAHGVRGSVLLRGAQGFGRPHRLRTDRLLTLSEDLPVVSVAFDAAERIEALLPAVEAIASRGLITLERARLLDDGPSSADGAPGPHDETKLTVYVGRRQTARGRPAFVTICELLHRRGLAGATVLLGVDGTRGGRRLRARFVSGNPSVPMMIIAVGATDRIAAAIADLRELVPDATAMLERVRVCKRDGRRLVSPDHVTGRDEHGLARWQKLSVYTSAHATTPGPGRGRALHVEIVRRLRSSDAAGATSLRGVWGFHGDHAPHGDRLMQVRRHVPVLTVVLDTPQRSARAFAVIDELTADTGLVTSETVPALQALSGWGGAGGLRLAGREP